MLLYAKKNGIYTPPTRNTVDLGTEMDRSKSFGLLGLTLAAVVISHGASAASIGSCTGGMRSATRFITNLDGILTDTPKSFTCSPTVATQIDTADGMAAVGVGATGGGVSAGAGALAPERNRLVTAFADTEVEFEFKVIRATPGSTPFLVHVDYEVLLTTVGLNFSATGSATTGAWGEGHFDIYEIGGSGAGGIPSDHVNGVAASMTVGDNVSLASRAILKYDTPYVLRFGVEANALAQTGSPPEGGLASAGADISLAASLALFAVSDVIPDHEDYEIVWAAAGGILPGAGVYPAIDPPLSLVPIPASLWLLGSGLGFLSVGGLRRRFYT